MKRGITILDTEKPGWEDRVDLEDFNVIGAACCPLYYAYRDEYPPERGNYFLEVVNRLFGVYGVRDLYEKCLHFGFDSDAVNDPTGEIITGVWRREIERRRG